MLLKTQIFALIWSAEAMYKKIHVIINPASGIAEPVLTDLNWAFKEAGVEWEALVTKDAGDAANFARQALKKEVDVIAMYGGDGTVMEVANELKGSTTPMAILPGGTANVMAKELGIPVDLPRAIALMLGEDHEIREVDIGEAKDRCFLVRLSIGILASMEENAERQTKARMGTLAYVLAGLQAIRDPTVAHYKITIDGETFEAEGVGAFLANSGNVGIQGLSLVHTISVSDGLLDLLVIQKANLGSLLQMAATAIVGDDPPPVLQHWQGREITVSTDPVQSVTLDGEPWSETPVTIHISEQKLRVIVPKTSIDAAA
jgi:diacylglycerol kinase (ATP)